MRINRRGSAPPFRNGIVVIIYHKLFVSVDLVWLLPKWTLLITHILRHTAGCKICSIWVHIIYL